MKKYDIAIIGGAMVGAALAVGFAKQGRSVVIIEEHLPKSFDSAKAIDLRVSAISYQSVQFLKELGAWEHIKNMRAFVYEHLATWEDVDSKISFAAKELDLNYLGYIVENRIIQLGLYDTFKKYPNLELKLATKLTDIEFADLNLIHLANGEKIQTQWVIGADGANSLVRSLAGIGISAWDYRQHCMLINVQTTLGIASTTWQHFTPCGPRAFLPLGNNMASLVWYDTSAKINQLQMMSHQQLQLEIAKHFPKHLGNVKVLQFGSFALTRRHAQTYFNRNCVLVGDAAHTINPLAGQGVNLGFKDAWALLKITAQKELIPHMLVQYEKQRYKDNLLMQTSMDLLYKAFNNNVLPIKVARNATLRFIRDFPLIKKQILKYALGLI